MSKPGSASMDAFRMDDDARKAFYASLADEKPTEAAGDSLVGWARPVESDALAVHPSQVEGAREDARQKGVSVEFLPDGRPVFTSSRQFREYAKRYGFRHRGYA